LKADYALRRTGNERMRWPVNRAAHLILCAQGIHDLTADIPCHPDFVHGDLAAGHAGVDDLGEIAAMREIEGESLRPARVQGGGH